MVGLIKAFAAELNLKVWRWIIGLHRPLDIGPPTYTWCRTCSAPWPCKEFVNAADQIDSLTGGSSDQRRR